MKTKPREHGCSVPSTLRDAKQWVCWDEKKIPYRADGMGRASSTDEKTWSSYTAACAAADASDNLGIGYVFVQGDGIIGIDLDDVIAGDQILPWAKDLIRSLDTYCEITPSGCGVHLYVAGTYPKHWRHRAAHPGGGSIECYSGGRYFTVTGQAITDERTIAYMQPDSLAMLEKMLGKVTPEPRPTPVRSVAPHETGNHARYARSALIGECDAVARAPEGGRNIALNTAALKMGSLVASGVLDASEVVSSLSIAATSAGLDASEIEGTLRSGYTAGLARPRELPVSATPRPTQHAPVKDESEQPSVIELVDIASTTAIALAAPVVEGLLRIGEVALLCGAAKTKKTWMALALAHDVASASDFVRQMCVQAARPVLYIDAECGQAVMGSRVKLLRIARAPLIEQISLYACRGVARPSIGVACNLMRRAIEQCGAELCIVDTLSAYFPAQNENDNSEATDTMGQILRVADESQCAIVLIHHTAKGGGEQRSAVDAASGASAYARRADTVITLRDDPQGEMMLDVRSRSFPPVDRHCITWDSTMRPKGEPITAATMADIPAAPRRNKSRV